MINCNTMYSARGLHIQYSSVFILRVGWQHAWLHFVINNHVEYQFFYITLLLPLNCSTVIRNGNKPMHSLLVNLIRNTFQLQNGIPFSVVLLMFLSTDGAGSLDDSMSRLVLIANIYFEGLFTGNFSTFRVVPKILPRPYTVVTRIIKDHP